MKTFKIYSKTSGHFLSTESATNQLGALVSYYKRIGAPRPKRVHSGVVVSEVEK